GTGPSDRSSGSVLYRGLRDALRALARLGSDRRLAAPPGGAPRSLPRSARLDPGPAGARAGSFPPLARPSGERGGATPWSWPLRLASALRLPAPGPPLRQSDRRSRGLRRLRLRRVRRDVAPRPSSPAGLRAGDERDRPAIGAGVRDVPDGVRQSSSAPASSGPRPQGRAG